MKTTLLLSMTALLLASAAACGDPDTDFANADIENQAPAALLQAPLTVELGETILLDASGSADEDGQLVEYWFQVGQEAPILQSVSPQIFHTFTAPGEVLITLTVIDDGGTKDTDRVEIVVAE